MKIQLGHYEFDLADRYRAGSILTEAEAKALNITRSERIRNQVARWLGRAAPNKEVLTGEKRAELYERVAKLDSSYEFESRPVTKAKVGTMEAEIREVAQERAEALARQRNRHGDVMYIEQVFSALLDDPGVEAEAAARIEVRRSVVAQGLGDL